MTTATACPACGMPPRPGIAFCTACGASLDAVPTSPAPTSTTRPSPGTTGSLLVTPSAPAAARPAPTPPPPPIRPPATGPRGPAPQPLPGRAVAPPLATGPARPATVAAPHPPDSVVEATRPPAPAAAGSIDAGIGRFATWVSLGLALAFLTIPVGEAINKQLALTPMDHQSGSALLTLLAATFGLVGFIAGVYTDARHLERQGVEVSSTAAMGWALLVLVFAVVVVPVYLSARHRAVAAHVAPDEPVPGWNVGAIVVGVAAVIAMPILVAMSAALWQPTYVVRTPATPTASTSITEAKYDGLYKGMTVAQAQAMLGSPGRRVSSMSAGRSDLETYQWESGTVTVMVGFENGRLFTKAQTGL